VEESTARVVDLEPVTVEANRLWFDGVYAPVQGATIGLKTILAGRRIMLMAFGEHKAGAVQAMVDGPLTPSCPASFLQNHRSVEVYLDQKAARRLRR
jgi:glucosamine-6-phosphate deaminase